MPPRGRKKVKIEPKSDVVEVNLMEHLPSDDEDDDIIVPVKRKSARPSKPVITAPNDSDCEEIESDDSDKGQRGNNSSKKKSNGVVKNKNTPNQKSSKPKSKPKVILKMKAPVSKGTKSDTEEEELSDEEEEDLEENSEEETKSKGNAKRKPSTGKGKGGGGKGKGKGRKGKSSDESEGDEEDDIEYDETILEAIDDGESSTNVWVKPDYKDKAWFKKNCLLCQVCKKTHKTTGDALGCFNKHKKNIRCFVCFMILPNGQDATKRLFKHYLKRHDQGEKQGTVKCPHCENSISFKSVSCHIIDKHFSEALDPSEKCTADPNKENVQKKKGKKKSGDDDEEEGSSDESENEDQDEDEEDGEGEETEEEVEDEEEEEESDG